MLTILIVHTDLSGTTPQPDPATTSLAGITHHLPLATRYYSASVPVWLDVIANPSDWASSFLAPEAKEVLEVLGGLVVVFGFSSGSGGEGGKARAKELLAHVGKVVREGLGGWEWDGVLLAVGVGEVGTGEDGEEALDEWEDVCTEWGLEFVHVSSAASAAAPASADTGGAGDVPGQGTRNEFGERMGISRALEALQANSWSGSGGGEDEEGEFGAFMGEEDDDLGEFDPESMDFGFDREDFIGLRKAIWSAGGEDGDDAMNVDGGEPSNTRSKGGGGDGEAIDEEMGGEEDVQKIERMMLKLQAVRDMSAGMPEEQRKRMAKDAVGEVMKEL